MWVWASMRPGRSVMPGRSIVVAPAGAELSAPEPAARIVVPWTTTVQPWWMSTPSNTAAGRRIVGAVGCGADAGWVGTPDVRADWAPAGAAAKSVGTRAVARSGMERVMRAGDRGLRTGDQGPRVGSAG